MGELDKRLIDESNLTDAEKAFKKEYLLLEEICVAAIKAEIDGIIQRYAKQHAETLLQLYEKYFKEGK
jgi:hypothetical protein